ncbi:hypothetical protein LZ554_000214 [Drepanopeziza brunnea f. sp. 'monogermtubi']|nr:hypothetical protein LZ554_000214 [Drepanopeziza brunnea f. sp. 'monogermtubi']
MVDTICGTVLRILLTTLYNIARLAKSIAWDWPPFKIFLTFSSAYVYHDQIEAYLAITSSWVIAFAFLFVFKFLKVVIHTASFLLYRPYPVPLDPTITPQDVTVIIPTIGAIDEDEFRETLKTILLNKPAEIIVCTVGSKKRSIAERVCAEKLAKAQSRRPTNTLVHATSIEVASKREQIFKAIQRVETPIIALADDHVFWPENYLEAALAPFEDPAIGAVGTNKRVRREPFEFTWANFLNFIACLYLERHNFECTASVNIDSGVFVLSGRTAFYRTSILKHPRFEEEYLHETWLYGLVGKHGFAVDDDNCLTRFTVGIAKYKVWFQNSVDSTMCTTLGRPNIFFKQMDRWIRTTWRSNTTSLFSDQTPWKAQPWSVYAVYLSSFVNIALLYDSALLITLWFSLRSFETASETVPRPRHCPEDPAIRYHPRELSLSTEACPDFASTSKSAAMGLLVLVLFLSKMIKPFPHYWRNPKDMLWIPGAILFGYYHSLIKIKALCTVWVVSWGTRPGVQ